MSGPPRDAGPFGTAYRGTSCHSSSLSPLVSVILLLSLPLLAPHPMQDPEIDFYLNVAHLQLHRRGRALHRLATLCTAAAATIAPNASGISAAAASAAAASAPSPSPALMRCLQDVCVPLLAAILQEPGTGSGERAHDKKVSTRQGSKKSCLCTGMNACVCSVCVNG